LDAEGHLFEAIEGEAGERLAGGAAPVDRVRSEDVDEEVHDARPLELPEDLGDAGETERGLVFVLELDGRLGGALEGGQDPGRIFVGQTFVSRASSALRLEEFLHRG